MTTDQAIRDLHDTMKDAIDFLEKESVRDTLSTDEELQKLIQDMCNLLAQCGYFIKGYIADRDFCSFSSFLLIPGLL